MEAQWLCSHLDFNCLILAGDVGGTNTTLALVGEKEGKYTIIVKFKYQSNKISNLVEPVEEVISLIKEKFPEATIDKCCLSPAGPVENNYCKLTNCAWDVDGNEIRKTIRIDTLIINDFTAIGYGIPTLDVDDIAQITKLPATDGNCPERTGTVKAVVGAGTGLGVGFLTPDKGKYHAYPSEGGHSGFAAFDEETKALKEYVADKIGTTPGTEPFVSGQGIANIFNYMKEKKNMSCTGVLSEIEAADDPDKPALISKNATTNGVCKQIMQLFIRMYGRFAGSIAVLFIPTAGLYLAGGIVTKNEALFLEDNLFMRNFEQNYNPNIRPLLKKIPVYIIKDYSISLYGAANAAVILME
ncbi:MAG: glucokinase [Spirochaetales bacterium]|nr:glucokinase [Spirochaetales bacterium]